MDERDLEPEQAGVRLGVDELRALALERGQCRADVRDLERDMVHTRAARSEKPPDGRVAFERREELDPPAADEHGRRLDALLRHGRAVLELGAEEARVRLERVVEVGDGHAEMMDAAWAHATDGTWRYSADSGTTRDTPTKSLERESTAVSASKASSSSRTSVSFSSSAAATRSSAGRYLVSSRTASTKAWSVSRACSLSRSRFVSSDSA